MGTQAHWEKIYKTKAPDEVSWFSPHLKTSLNLIQRVGCGPFASIIDMGGGESTLVDDLIARGYQNVTVMDISHTAIEHTKKRLGPRSQSAKWVIGDIMQANLPPET